MIHICGTCDIAMCGDCNGFGIAIDGCLDIIHETACEYDGEFVTEKCGSCKMNERLEIKPSGLANLGYNIELRDIFAGMAMQAMVSEVGGYVSLAIDAYEMADAMLEARNKQNGTKED